MTDEQRQQRLHYHMYDSCEGIAQQSERIVALEELVVMLHACAYGLLIDLAPSCFARDGDGCGMDCLCNGEGCCLTRIENRMSELGIEVDRWLHGTDP